MTMTRIPLARPILLLFAVLCLLFCLAACGGKKEPATERETEESEPTVFEATLPFSGETLTIDDWTIEIRGLSFTDTVILSDIISYNADNDEYFAIVSLKVTNGAGEERTFLPAIDISGFDYLQDEFQEDGQNVKETLLIGYHKTLRSAALQPKEAREGTLIYSVSRKAAESGTLELFFNKISGVDFTSTEQKTLDSVSVKFR